MPYIFVILVAINAVYLGYAAAKQSDLHLSGDLHQNVQVQQHTDNNN